MEPIEESEASKRRTRLENAQRTAAYFRTSAAKERKDAATEAAREKPAPEESTDSLDFSSEFTDQDTGMSGAAGELNWDALIEDDWLDEDEEDEEGDGEDEEGGHQGEQSQHDSQQDQEDEEPATPAPKSGFGAWKPPANTGFKKWAPAQSSTGAAPLPVEKPSVEKQLGFEWGAVQKKEEKPEPDGPALDLDGEAGEASESRTFNPPPKQLPPRKSELAAGVIPAHQNPATYVAPRPRPERVLELPVQGRLEGVDQRLVSAARLLVTNEETDAGYEECVRLLTRFGLGALRLCSRQKVRVVIIDEEDFPTRPELTELGLENEELPVDGAYVVKSRTCLIDRRCLLEKPRFFHPALYYFSHALDHAQGGDVFSSRKAAAVRACFEASTEGLNGCDFVDELAAADPVRYFARSVAIYLGRDDCLEPIWTNEDLRDFDRSMFDYLEYLFARFAV